MASTLITSNEKHLRDAMFHARKMLEEATRALPQYVAFKQLEREYTEAHMRRIEQEHKDEEAKQKLAREDMDKRDVEQKAREAACQHYWTYSDNHGQTTISCHKCGAGD
jgi:hypothetical protein